MLLQTISAPFTAAALSNVESDSASVRFSAVISALSFALDLTEGQPMGHAVRTCLLGMRLAEQIGLPVAAQADLYYALLLKDAGCSSNASKLYAVLGTDEIKAKGAVKTVDWTRQRWESLQYALSHVQNNKPFLQRVAALFDVARKSKQQTHDLIQIRCERGASIARRIGLSERTAQAIHSLDELWNGEGHPCGLRGSEIPILSRIMNLAQTLDVFVTHRGPEDALSAARQRSGRWFDPEIVQAALSLAQSGELWSDLDAPDLLSRIQALEPIGQSRLADENALDDICLAFADVVDAKSPFTYRHSNGVADASVLMATQMGMSTKEVRNIRRAALLHDVGKLAVSNAILEKPGKPTEEEWTAIKRHPYYTLEVLKRIPGFGDLSEVAAAHHEKLDGTGYFRHWGSAQLSLPARILAVADIYDALSAKRPYRDALPLDQVFKIMQKDAPHALDAACLDTLQAAKLH